MSFNLRKFYTFGFIAMIGFVLLFASPLSVFADNYQACKDVVNSNTNPISILNLFSPGNYIPLIPEQCALDGNATANLPLTFLPIMLVRLYGLISSLAIYLFFIGITVTGVRWSIAGFTDNGYTDKIKKDFQNAVVAIVVVLLAYLIVSTIATLLGLGDLLTQDLLNLKL